MAVYRFAVWAKHRERIETGGRPEIERQYGALAAEILAEWEEQSTETNSTVNAEERARGAGAL